MKIELIENKWIINDGEYIIYVWEYLNHRIKDEKYCVRDCDGEEVYCNNDFEKCLIWIYNSI